MTEIYKRRFQEYFKSLFKYKGRNFSDTEHSVARFKERFPQYTIQDYIKVVEKGIDTIINVFKDSFGKYIIISKSTNIAVQIEWRKDNRFNDGKNHGFSATTLDYNTQKKELKADTKLFVESFKKEKLERFFDTNDYIQMIKETGYYCLNIDDCEHLKVYIKEGQIYRDFEVILIE